MRQNAGDAVPWFQLSVPRQNCMHCLLSIQRQESVHIGFLIWLQLSQHITVHVDTYDGLLSGCRHMHGGGLYKPSSLNRQDYAYMHILRHTRPLQARTLCAFWHRPQACQDHRPGWGYNQGCMEKPWGCSSYQHNCQAVAAASRGLVGGCGEHPADAEDETAEHAYCELQLLLSPCKTHSVSMH